MIKEFVYLLTKEARHPYHHGDDHIYRLTLCFVLYLPAHGLHYLFASLIFYYSHLLISLNIQCDTQIEQLLHSSLSA